VSWIFETVDLCKSFGSLKVANNINMRLRAGEIRALIGPNGAGKTTFFNLISGKIHPSSGRVKFEGRDLAGLAPYEIVRAGIGRSFQITNIFPRLGVLQNMTAAVLARKGKASSVFVQFEACREEKEEALALLSQIGLVHKSMLATSSLSHGERRYLEFGVALALRPRMLLLDEPTAGMSPEETASTVVLIRKIAENTTVLFTEHDMSIVFSIADRITVLQQGTIIAEGTPDEVRSDSLVKTAYLGE
jgi:branched-chain amino acid transport system ATP-binding protein